MKLILKLGAIVLMVFGTSAQALTIDFGNDSSEWANDNECDDARFGGAGMTTTPLLQEDVMADASDCQNAYNNGLLHVLGVSKGRVDFGDDAGEWANDGECDDMRFEGPGMTTTPLLQDDILHDATDCKNAFDNGRLWMRGISR